MKRKRILLYILLLLLPCLLLLVRPDTTEEPQGYTVELYRNGQLETLPLRDYLWGVLAGEMPASYPMEALKAQVVASYSYLRFRTDAGDALGHPGDICADPNHCKAYLSPAEAAAKWGKDWLDASRGKLAEAVEAVLGEVLCHDGKPANTVFHAISGGRTESSEAVWGGALPYLISVDSHWDAAAAGYASEVRLSLGEFCEKLGVTDPTLGGVTLSAGGSVDSLSVGGKTFTGRELRSLFGLRSTRFTLTLGEEAVFAVKGYGHQVGMSQYGASVLAAKGYSYADILAYYYPNTLLTENYFE